MIQSQIHRFNKSVAVSLRGGDSVYLKPDEAYKIAKAILDIVKDIGAQPDFTKSRSETVIVKSES